MTQPAQVTRLVTFNLEAAMIALYKTIDAFFAGPNCKAQRELYSEARKLAADAGIYILDLHGARGAIGERINVLRRRVRSAIEEGARK